MKKATVITISGKARHGKDTSAQILKSFLENAGKKVLIIHYADYLKFICKQYFGWNGEKDLAGRTLLQLVGTEKVRAKEPDFWVSIVDKFMNVFQDDYDYFIIPDTRFPNEIEFLKKAGWIVMTIKVIRPDFDNGLTEKQRNHPSETALDDYEFDYIMSATDIYQLGNACGIVVNAIIQKSLLYNH